jgi:hypothetical protein
LRAVVFQLTRVLGIALAFVLAGVFVGPWTAAPPADADDPQVLALAAHEVLAEECQETPVPPPAEDEEDVIVPHPQAPPPAWLVLRSALRTYDALGPPLHSPDVETPPPRA